MTRKCNEMLVSHSSFNILVNNCTIPYRSMTTKVQKKKQVAQLKTSRGAQSYHVSWEALFRRIMGCITSQWCHVLRSLSSFIRILLHLHQSFLCQVPLQHDDCTAEMVGFSIFQHLINERIAERFALAHLFQTPNTFVSKQIWRYFNKKSSDKYSERVKMI